MKKLILALSTLLVLSSSVQAQYAEEKPEILWGKEFKASKRSTLEDIVGYDESGIYAINSKIVNFITGKKKYTLQRFDRNMNLAQSVEFEQEHQGHDLDYEFILHLNQRLFLFTSSTDRNKNLKALYTQELNKKTLVPISTPNKIAETEYTFLTKSNTGNFNWEISSDSSKVLIYYNLAHKLSKTEKYALQVLDNELRLLWKTEVNIPHGEDVFTVRDYLVDPFGEVHILGRLYKEKQKEKRNGEPNYNYQILSYTNNGTDFEQYTVDLEGKFLTEMKIAVNDHQDIICGGFYSSKGTTSIDGSYFLKIDGQSKEIVSQEFEEFSLDFITENLSARQEKKAKKKAAKGKNLEMFQYDLRKIILNENGGAVLIGEQFFIHTSIVYTSTANGGGSTTTNYQYYYNSIIVINMSAEGKIEWTKSIPKRQVTSNDNGFFSSFALSVVGDKLYFVYNDNPKNLLPPEKKGDIYAMSGSRKKRGVTLATLSLNGDLKRESLVSAGEVEIYIRPKTCEQISQNELIIFGQRKKKQRFAKVTFKP